jgi:hypothetical protein
VDNCTFSEKNKTYIQKPQWKKRKKIKMDRIDTEKIMTSEHGGLPSCNTTTCISACMEFVEY